MAGELKWARDLSASEGVFKDKLRFKPETLKAIKKASPARGAEIVKDACVEFVQGKYGVKEKVEKPDDSVGEAAAETADRDSPKLVSSQPTKEGFVDWDDAKAKEGKTDEAQSETVSLESGKGGLIDWEAVKADEEKKKVEMIEEAKKEEDEQMRTWMDQRNDDLAALGMGFVREAQESGKWEFEDSEGNVVEFDSRDEALDASVADYYAQEELRFEGDKQGLNDSQNPSYRVDGEVAKGADGKPVGLRDAAARAMADHLDGDYQLGKNAEFDWSQSGKKVTVNDVLKKGKSLADTMRARLAIDAEIEGLENGMSHGARRVLGQNTMKILNNGGVRSVQNLYEGADPCDVVEERTEGIVGELILTGEVSIDEFIRNIQEVERATGNKYLTKNSGNERLAVQEAVSRLARDWMLGKVKDEAMPSLIKKWLRRVIIWVGAAKEIADSLRRGRALMDADQRGELDKKFTSFLDDLVGVNPEARAARAQADSEAAIMAEAMGGYDEIGDWAKGKLMFPKEAREAHDDLAGELERVYDGLTTEKAAKAKMVDGKWVESKSKRVTAKANKYFVRGGMSPAALFELAQEAGFEFENTGDMLSALYDSVAHGIKHYNMGSVDAGLSYSLAAADEVEGQRVSDAWHKVEAMEAVVSDHPEVYDMERSKAVAYARERYRLLQQKFQRDGFIVEVDGGKKVGVTRKGFMEVKNHIADRRNLSALASLDDILKNAKYLHSADNTDKGRKPDIVQFHYYMTKASFPGYLKYKQGVGDDIGGINIEDAYVVSIISEDKEGHLFYDITLQNIESVNKIKETSKSLPRLRVPNSAQIGDASLKTRLEYLQAFVNYIDEKNKNDDKKKQYVGVKRTVAQLDDKFKDGVLEASNAIIVKPEENVSFSIEAWHGTPHDVNKFKLEKVGTGEGAQAYGWGLYFAGNKKTAEWYRDKLSDHGKGSLLHVILDADREELLSYENSLGLSIEDAGESPIISQKDSVALLQWGKIKTYGDLLSAAEDLEFSGGSLCMEVLLGDVSGKDMNEDIDDFYMVEYYAGLYVNTYLSGRRIYDYASSLCGGDQQASLWLYKRHIKGIIYADGATRNKDSSEQDYNYVIFGEDEISIIEKYDEFISFSIAPNGEKSNLTPTQWHAVRTPAFKKWFGDWENDPANASKVLDENGEPMVVYHGTSDKFSRFDISEVREREGSFFFAQNKRDAADYAGIGHVMALFINLRNPINYDTFDFPEVFQNKREQVAYLKDKGYDGWMAEMEDGYGEVSAFYPNQIKSATDNRGAFDAGNEDISFSIAPQEEKQWKSSLNDYLSKGATDRALPIKMSSVPNVLQALGFSNRDVVITPSTLDKVMGGKHNLDQSHVERLAAAIHDPIMIVDSATQAEAIVVLTEVKTDKGNVIAAIHLDKRAHGGVYHVVASAYDKNSPWMFVDQIKAGKLRYIDKKRALIWTRDNRLQLPARMPSSKGSLSVLTPEDIVKWKNAQDGKSFDTGNEDISFSIAPAEAVEWGGRVDEYVAGKLDRSRNLRVCSTPPVLQMLGAEDLDLEIAPSVIDKCVGGKHGLSYDDLKAVVGEIYDPIAVFESASVGDSMVVLTELKEGGKNVIVAVHLDVSGHHGQINVVASLYGKNNQNALFDLPPRYINNKKAVSWGKTQRLQLPRVFTKKGSDKNVKNPEDVVKWKNALDGKSFSLGPVEDGKSTPLNDGTVWAALSNAMEQGARKKVEVLKAYQERLKAELDAAGMNEDGTLKFADWNRAARLKPRIDSFTIAVRGWFDKQGLAIPQKIERLIASVEKGETSGDIKKLVRALKAGYEMDKFIEERLKKGGFDEDGGTKALLKDIGKEFTRETALRLLGVTDAVIEALPKILQDRLWMGDVSRVKNQILTAKTIKGQQSGLCRLIRMVNWAVEGSLKVQMLDEIDRLLKWSEEREGENRVKRGKLMVDVQKEIRQIRSVLMLDEKEVQARMNEVETELGEIGDVSSPRYTELLLRMNRLDVYGNLRKRTEKGRLEEGSARFERAVEDLRSLYGRGRQVNKFMVAHHRERREALVAAAAAAIGRPDALDATESTDSQTAHGKFKGFLRNWLSYENVLEDIFGEVDFVNDLVEKDRRARLALNNARHGRNLAYYDRAARIFGVRVTDEDGNDKRGVMGGVDSSVVRKVNRAVAELSVPRPWGIMKRRTGEWHDEVVNVDDAAALMGGEVFEGNLPEWWNDDVARNAFEKAFDGWSEHFGDRESFEFSWLKENDEMIELNLSDMEALYVLQLAGMEQYEDNLRADGFGEKVLEEMREKISDKALALGEFFGEEYEAGYEPMNEVYQRLFYTSLPKVKNYAPGNFKVSGKMDAVDPMEAQGSGWLAMGAIKCRKPHRAQIDIKSAAHVYWQHTMQTDHWLHYAEYVREIKGVFKDASIKSKISSVLGASTYEALNDWVEMIENEGPKSKESAKWYVQLSNRVLGARAQGGLTFNKNTLVRQLPAAFASWGDMDMMGVVRGLYGTVTNWDSLSVVWNDDALQQRLYGGMSPEIQAGLKASDMTMSRLGELIKAGMVPIQFFDAAFTTLSGAVAYNAAHQSHMKGVGSKMLKENERLVREEAHELGLAAMDKAVRKTAQPMDVEQKSLAELQAKGLMRHLFLFRSDPRKQFALTYMAISKLSKGEIGLGTAAWRVFNSWIMYGVLNQLTTDIVLAIGGSFDDEDDDFFSSIDDYVLSGCLGALSCFYGVSEAVEFAIRKFFGKKTMKFDNSVEGSVDVLARSYKKIAEGESFTVAEMAKVGSAIGRSVNNLGVLALIGKPEYGAAMAAGGRVAKDAVNMVAHWGSSDERAEKALVKAAMEGVVKDKDERKEIDAVRDKIAEGIAGKTVGERKREYAKLKLKGGDVTAVENRVAKARLSETAYMLRGLNKEQRLGVLKRLKESEMKPEKYQKLEQELREFGVK